MEDTLTTPEAAIRAQFLGHVIITKDTWTAIMWDIMQALEAYPGKPPIRGPEKKRILLRLLRDLIDQLPGNEGAEKEALLGMLQLLPAQIDLIVAAANGMIQLGKDVKGCCSSCC